MNNKLNSEFCKCGTEATYTRLSATEKISYDAVDGWHTEIDSADDYFKCTKCNCMPPEKIFSEADTYY